MGRALWVHYLEDPILIMSVKSAELRNLKYREATNERRMRSGTLREEMDVTVSVIRNLESRALKWYDHIERLKEERLPKNMMCSLSLVEERESDVHLNGKYIA